MVLQGCYFIGLNNFNAEINDLEILNILLRIDRGSVFFFLSAPLGQQRKERRFSADSAICKKVNAHTLQFRAYSDDKNVKADTDYVCCCSARVATAQRRHQARVPLRGGGKPGGATAVRTCFLMDSPAPWWLF